MDKLAQAFEFRHACKVFDESKKISESDFDYIINAGIKSPSSFGMEPWHFVVVNDDKNKHALSPLCYEQKQIKTCSHLIIVLYRKASFFKSESTHLKKMLERNYAKKSATFDLNAAIARFVGHAIKDENRGVSLDNWADQQCYIAAGNMLTAAAYKEIDSCALGGIDNEKIEQFLSNHNPKLNLNDFAVSLVLAFGYRLNEQSEKLRCAKQDTVTYL